MWRRDNEASAPAEFPPEQPEADLQPDEDEYGADEADLEEEVVEEGAPETNGEGSSANATVEDAAMAGVTNGDGEPIPEEDEMSEDGSVDIEGDSEDEEEEEGAPEEGAADGDEMDVDMGDAPDSHPQSEVMAH